jgi:hypothetical protein
MTPTGAKMIRGELPVTMANCEQNLRESIEQDAEKKAMGDDLRPFTITMLAIDKCDVECDGWIFPDPFHNRSTYNKMIKKVAGLDRDHA